jgi:hypothetical protein
MKFIIIQNNFSFNPGTAPAYQPRIGAFGDFLMHLRRIIIA